MRGRSKEDVGEATPNVSQRMHGNQGQDGTGGCSGPVCVPVQHPTRSCGQIRLRLSFFPLGRGWHWLALKKLFQQQQGTPDANPNRARPGNEVISFSLFCWEASASGLGYLGSLEGGKALWRVLLFPPPPH